MGGSRSEEFLHPTPVGEDTFVQLGGRLRRQRRGVHHARAPGAPDRGVAGAAGVRLAGHPDHLHAGGPRQPRRSPRPDRPWTAADTLKNVVLALTHLDGSRDLVVIGLPGDREVDLKRVEVAFAPAEVEAATEADFAGRPGLVKGYIGPWTSDCAVLGEKARSGIRYLLDPRVVDGTQWITGANEHEKHVLRPGRRPRLRRRRNRGGGRGARRRPGPGWLRPDRARGAAWRSGTCSSSGASTPRRSDSRCSTRTASSSP